MKTYATIEVKVYSKKEFKKLLDFLAPNEYDHNYEITNKEEVQK